MIMRTTLTIEDDLAGILRRKSRELGMPFKEVVNMALRKGLSENPIHVSHQVVVRPHDFGHSPGIDLDRLNQLVDELEVGDFLRKANFPWAHTRVFEGRGEASMSAARCLLKYQRKRATVQNNAAARRTASP